MCDCIFCKFDEPADAWTIRLFRQTSYKYEGEKYMLNIVYPSGGPFQAIKELEVYYCPMCGRKLGERNE